MPQLPPTPVDIALEMAKVLKSSIIAASPRVGKGVVVSKAIAFLNSDLAPRDLNVQTVRSRQGLKTLNLYQQ
jgi:hypothetical protein